MGIPRLFNVDQDGDTLIVALKSNVGNFADGEMTADLEHLIARLKQPDVNNVVIDFERIPYFGSIMLEAQLVLFRQVQGSDGKMTVCNVSDVGREILQLSRFDRMMPIFDSRVEALQAIRHQ